MDFQFIGKQIRRQRMNAGLTQEQLAEAAGLSPSYLSHVERGTKSVRLNTLEQIAEALNVPLIHLLNQQPSASGEAISSEADAIPELCTNEERQIILEVSQTLARCLRKFRPNTP